MQCLSISDYPFVPDVGQINAPFKLGTNVLKPITTSNFDKKKKCSILRPSPNLHAVYYPKNLVSILENKVTQAPHEYII